MKATPGESIRKYNQCFFEVKANVINVSDSDVIDYWINGFYHREDTRIFGCFKPKTIEQLHEMIREWAGREDQEKVAHDDHQRKQYNNRNDNHDDRRGDARSNDNRRSDNLRGDELRWNNPDQSRKRKSDDTVATIKAYKLSKGFKSVLYEKYPFHPNNNHPSWKCYGLQKVFKEGA